MSSKSTNDEFPFSATFEDDGSITFDWDPNHPVTSIFNDWTEDDFADMLINACKEALTNQK
jgi:hypothetical protein